MRDGRWKAFFSRMLLFTFTAAICTSLVLVITSSPPDTVSIGSWIFGVVLTSVFVAIFALPVGAVWALASNWFQHLHVPRPHLDLVLGAIAGAGIFVLSSFGGEDSTVRPLLAFACGFAISAFVSWRRSPSGKEYGKRTRTNAIVTAIPLIVVAILLVLPKSPITGLSGQQNLAADSVEVPPGSANGMIDIEQVMAPRVLGQLDAAVSIEEFASLTCGHCGDFHKDTFPLLRDQYIDRGLVRFTLTDFPLDTRSRDASLIGRCVPPANFYQYVSNVFAAQASLMSTEVGDLRIPLAAASGLGSSDDELRACQQSEELRQSMAGQMREAIRAYDLTETPTIVINGDVVLVGNQPFSLLAEHIERLLAADEAER